MKYRQSSFLIANITVAVVFCACSFLFQKPKHLCGNHAHEIGAVSCAYTIFTLIGLIALNSVCWKCSTVRFLSTTPMLLNIAVIIVAWVLSANNHHNHLASTLNCVVASQQILTYVGLTSSVIPLETEIEPMILMIFANIIGQFSIFESNIIGSYGDVNNAVSESRHVLFATLAALTILSLLYPKCSQRMYQILSRNAIEMYEDPDIFVILMLRIASVVFIVSKLAVFYLNGNSTINQKFEFNSAFILIHGVIVIAGTFSRVSYINRESINKSNYVKYISHEIRSPISTVTLGIDLAIATMMDIRHPKAQHTVEMLRDVNLSCNIAINSINNLLDFDKIKNCMMDMEFKIVFSSHFVKRCVRPFLIQAQSTAVFLSCSLPDESLTKYCINVDGYRLEQVLRNFLSNALKFSKAGGSVRVKCSYMDKFSKRHPFIGATANATGVYRIEVHDEGPGLNEAQLSKLFGQYVQFNAATLQEGKGSGLGLWLSKMIVDMHGGVIGATSPGEGHGSIFFIEIPCYVVKADIDNHRTVLPLDNMGNHGGHKIGFDIEANRDNSLIDEPVRSRTASFETELRSLHTTIDCELVESDSKSTIVTKSRDLERIPNLSVVKPNDDENESNRTASTQLSLPSPVSPRKIDLSTTSEKMLRTRALFLENKISVLIVDDSLLSRKMMVRVLSPICHRCDQACDGSDAVDIVSNIMESNEKPYDAILMDLFMPRMCGPEAVKQIRSRGYKGAIIGVTGASENDSNNFIDSGADKVLTKPVNIDVLVTTLQSILNITQ